MTDFVELLSLALTVPTLILSAWVAFIYGKESIAIYYRARRGIKLTGTQLLISGIAVGFAGSFFDNLYWGLAWLAEFTDSDYKNTLFGNGVYSNVPFRQTAGIVAAGLHLAASYRVGRQRFVLLLLCLLTLAVGLSLFIVKARIGDIQ